MDGHQKQRNESARMIGDALFELISANCAGNTGEPEEYAKEVSEAIEKFIERK